MARVELGGAGSYACGGAKGGNRICALDGGLVAMSLMLIVGLGLQVGEISSSGGIEVVPLCHDHPTR